MAAVDVTSLVILLMVSSFAVGGCVDNKCAACEAVAGELEIGLFNEKPKNHLDLRHRLDSKGQRVGKMIDYRVSELRVVELLDGLCEKMQDYTLEKRDSSKQEWAKVNDWDDYMDNKQEAKAHLRLYRLTVVGESSGDCNRRFEATDGCLRILEFAELIRKGSVKVGGVSKVLCQDLSKHCSQTSGFDEEDGLQNEAKDDL